MDFSCWVDLKNLHIIFNLKQHCYDQRVTFFSIHKQMKIPFNINSLQSFFQQWFSQDIQGSRTIAPKENCPPTPKLTLSQTLTLTEGQSSSVAIVWLSPNPKTNPHLDPNPNPNRGAIFLGGQLSVYRHLAGCLSASR